MRVAALDLGSNTFLCLLAEGTSDSSLLIHEDLTETVRLGQGLKPGGVFHSEALLRADKALQKFSEHIHRFRPQKVKAVATAAARNATNAFELIEIAQKYKIPLQVISGDEEALLTFQGSTEEISWSGKTLVVDIGGASTELIIASEDRKKIEYRHSFDVGGVSLTEQKIHQQPFTDLTELERFLEDIFQFTKNKKLTDLCRATSFGQALSVAGTPTTLASIEIGGFMVDQINKHFLSLNQLLNWQHQFTQTSVVEKRKQWPLLASRADIILAGTSILIFVLQKLGLKGTFVSTKGVRYGLALQLLHELRADGIGK